MIGQCCNFHGIDSTVEITGTCFIKKIYAPSSSLLRSKICWMKQVPVVNISWDIFRILADYRLRHLVNNLAHRSHDYIRMEITVLYLKIPRHQLSISWSQISVYSVSLPKWKTLDGRHWVKNRCRERWQVLLKKLWTTWCPSLLTV